MNKEVTEQGIKRKLAGLEAKDQLQYLNAGWKAMMSYFLIVIAATYIIARLVWDSWWSASMFVFVCFGALVLVAISDRGSKKGDLNRSMRIRKGEPLYSAEELEDDVQYESMWKQV